MPLEWVAIGANASTMAGLVAASLPDGARVVSTEAEFTSALWPFMVQGRGIEVTHVRPAELPEAIDSRTASVTFSAVQSSSGELADLDAVAEAARHHGALSLLDATPGVRLAAGRRQPVRRRRLLGLQVAALSARLGLHERAPGGGRTAGAARRGLVRRRGLHTTRTTGPPLRLASDARRLDVSPAWFSWVGTAPALEVLLDLGIETIRDHNLRLANLFREGLGLEPGDSAIVSAELPEAEERLSGTPVMASARAGMLRTSWHVYNTEDDVERVLGLLSGVGPPLGPRSGAA